MSQSIPAPQCNLIMPLGKQCGSPALRGRRFCYHHDGNHRNLIRERRTLERLDRLGNRLDAMHASELLNTLHRLLNTLPKTLSRFPEVSFTLTYTLDRLAEITSLESILYAFAKQNQEVVAKFTAKAAESTTCPQDTPAQ